MNRALLFSCTFFALTLAPLPAAAKNQAGQPDVKVKLSEEMEEKEEAFEKARKKLSKEQKKLVGEMEATFMSTVDPDIQILKLASEMEACGPEFVQQPDVIEKFNAFRNERNEKQTIMWGTFDQKYFPQVDFMDHKMLREHLALQLKIAMTVAAEMIKVKGAQFDKGQQCESAKSTLGLEAKAEEEAEASADE